MSDSCFCCFLSCRHKIFHQTLPPKTDWNPSLKVVSIISIYFLLISFFYKFYLLSVCLNCADIIATFLLLKILISGIIFRYRVKEKFSIINDWTLRTSIMISKKEKTVDIPKIMKFIDSPINVKTPSIYKKLKPYIL